MAFENIPAARTRLAEVLDTVVIGQALRDKLEPLTHGSPVDAIALGMTIIIEAEAALEEIPDALLDWCRDAAEAVLEHGFHGKGDLAEAFLAAHPEEEPQEQ